MPHQDRSDCANAVIPHCLTALHGFFKDAKGKRKVAKCFSLNIFLSQLNSPSQYCDHVHAIKFCPYCYKGKEGSRSSQRGLKGCPVLTLCLQGLQVQNMVWPPAVITIITSLASIPMNMFFIDRFHFAGAALAKSASRTLQSVLFCGAYLS